MFIIELLHNQINKKNKKRLVNKTPSLICSNCTGGFIYHWLGLKFYSPFINLYLTDYDFVKALSNWDSFLNFDIVEDFGTNKSYPVGISYDGIRIHFMHYSSFAEAKLAWDRRKKRIDPQNMGVMLTNWRGDESVIRDFEKLPFKHKVAFVNKDIPETDCTFFLST